MPRTVQTLIHDIGSYQPTGDETADLERLYLISDGFEHIEQLHFAVAAVFDAFERFPEAWWGNPGPLVHLVEHTYDRGHADEYVIELTQSVRRLPTPTTVWMVNRLLNSNLASDQREALLDVLKLAAEHLSASNETRAIAQEFLNFQTE